MGNGQQGAELSALDCSRPARVVFAARVGPGAGAEHARRSRPGRRPNGPRPALFLLLWPAGAPIPEELAALPFPALVDRIARAARAVPAPATLRTLDYRAELITRLHADGLETSTRETITSRGTADGYRGRLDLVTHDPVTGALAVVMIDKGQIQAKTARKFKALPAEPLAARVLILTRATIAASQNARPAVVDAVIYLA